ncbi:MAG: hypothetical protein KF723_15335 [Rhizobiaceae bacterium]|nr:hypothetical protein [Rhizobiaceae bacterium]
MPFPDLINCNGNWNDVCAALHQIFDATFNCNPPLRINGKRVVYDDRVIDGFEEAFWHMISRGKGNNRLPDFRRAERITWIAPMLACGHPDVTQFRDAHDKGGFSLYFWAKAHDFVVILREKKGVIVFVTAFYTDQQWMRDDLAKREARGAPF